MGYLNTSMTKRAGLLPASILASLGATGGGLAGYYGSDKANNTPSTVLGALGGGAGTIAGAIAGIRSVEPIDIALARLHNINPRWRDALALGALGLGATAGGALGAKLGSMGGDALA